MVKKVKKKNEFWECLRVRSIYVGEIVIQSNLI